MGQLKVPKPKAVIMDMMGTIVKSGFIEKVLNQYIKDNAETYVKEKWSDGKMKRDIDLLRKESDGKILAADAEAAAQQKSVVDYILMAVESKSTGKGFLRFRYHMWFDGYDNNKIQTPVYSDVAIQVKKWKDMSITLHVLSNSWLEATKKFLSKTTAGEMCLMIDGYYDAATEGSLTNKETYTKLVAKLKVSADQILFLTKAADEAKAAKEAGLNIVLVLTHRSNIDKLTDEEKAMPRIRSFNELDFESTTSS